MKDISNKKASILIWSVFLLLFLSTSFLYISTKIGRYMDESEDLSNSNSSKYEFLNWNTSLDDSVTWEKYTYSTSSVYTWVLRNLETLNLTWVVWSVNFNILSTWWTWTIYFSGTASTWTTNTGFIIMNNWDLFITNSGGYTNYTINLVDKFPKEYTISSDIWWKRFIKEIWEK